MEAMMPPTDSVRKRTKPNLLRSVESKDLFFKPSSPAEVPIRKGSAALQSAQTSSGLSVHNVSVALHLYLRFFALAMSTSGTGELRRLPCSKFRYSIAKVPAQLAGELAPQRLSLSLSLAGLTAAQQLVIEKIFLHCLVSTSVVRMTIFLKNKSFL